MTTKPCMIFTEPRS